MSEFIDVMALLPDEAPYFVVNTAVLSVDIRRPIHVPAYNYFLTSAGGGQTFHEGDSFIVLSAGFVLPESFGLAGGASNNLQNNPSIVIGAKPVGGSTFFLPNFGSSGILIPLENYEIPVNIFVNVNTLDIGGGSYPFRTTGFRLYCGLSGLNEGSAIYPKVSMVGVPAALNGTTQHLTVFLKIVHNFTLT